MVLTPTRFARLLAWFLLVLLTACGGGRNVLDKGQEPVEALIVAPRVAAPVLNVPFPAARKAVAQTGDTLSGVDAEQRSAGAVEDGATLVLTAATGGLEYALYRFNDGGFFPPDAVRIQLDAEATTAAWIGLANFESGRWDFSGPLSTPQNVDTFSPSYFSPAGDTWIAVVVAGGETARIDSLRADPDPWLDTFIDGGGGSLPGIGLYSSLEVVDGKPAIAYYDNDLGALKYARSNSADGTGAWTVVVVDSSGNETGPFASLAVIDGKPAICYYDGFFGDSDGVLKYAWNSEMDGSGAWNTVVVDASGDVGYFAALAEINGFPAISYADFTNNALKYAWSTEPDGSSGWNALTVDDADFAGNHTSLALVDGKPAISYHGGGSLRYAWSDETDGSAGWNNLTVDAEGVVGYYTSLAVIAGNPAISYYDSPNGDLKYAWSALPNGSAEWNVLVVDGAGNVGMYTSLAVIGGLPAISYHDFNQGHLEYATSTVADGSSGWSNITVDDSTDGAGEYSSLVEIDGKPAISYKVGTDLKYVVLTE